MIGVNPDQVSITLSYGRTLNSQNKQSLSLHLHLSYNLQKKTKKPLLWQAIALQKNTKRMISPKVL